MRLLLYCDDPGYGGTAVNARLLAAGLTDRGIEVWTAASRHGDAHPPAARFVPIDYDTAKNYPKTVTSANEPAEIFRAVNPDRVLFSDGWIGSSLAAKLVARQAGLPYAICNNYAAEHQAADLGGLLDFTREVTAGASRIVAVSRQNAQVLTECFAVPPDKVTVIPYGRPDAFFAPAGPAVVRARRAAFGVPDDGLLFFTAARYEERKGHRFLLDAMDILAATPLWPRLFFVWAGTSLDDTKAGLCERIRERGWQDKVFAMGAEKDVKTLLDACDGFILPSASEGLPLCIIEAMAAGKPVIATAVSGIPELVGNTGLLAADPKEDPAATAADLAQAVAVLAANPSLRAALGRQARERAEAEYREAVMVSRYERLIQAMPAAPGRAEVLAWYAERNAYAPGEPIRPGETPAFAEYAKDGWSHAEPGGRWTEGPEARLTVRPKPSLPERVVLSLTARPFMTGRDRGQTAVVCGNGAFLAAFPFEAPDFRQRLAVIETGSLKEAPALALAIRPSDPTSPATLGQGDDRRALGLFLREIALAPYRVPEGLTEALYALYLARQEFPEDCDFTRPGNLARFAAWFVLAGHEAHPDIPRRSVRLDWLQAPADTGQGGWLPVTVLMATLRDSRDDIKAAFPLDTPDDVNRFLTWYHAVALAEHDLGWTVRPEDRLALCSPTAADPSDPRSRLPRLVYGLWLTRDDLRRDYDPATPSGVAGLLAWMARRGMAEYDLTPLLQGPAGR